MTRPWLLGLVGLVACSTDITPLDLAGPPATVTASSALSLGGGATGTTVATPLGIVVVDADGKPTPAVPVSWQVGRGSLQVLDDSTDDNGHARAIWTLPSTPGPDQVTATVPSAGSIAFTATVTPVADAVVFRAIDAGSYHTCGITTGEQVICWGYNADGQLGLGGTEPHLFPELITGNPRYRLMTGGRYHTCATTLAGLGYCWGSDADGRLGDGQTIGQSNTPVPVRSDSTDPDHVSRDQGRTGAQLRHRPCTERLVLGLQW